VITKPISGILDATSKTSEGIKNFANSFDDKEDKPNENRIRYPRVFYGKYIILIFKF